jgi:hypothetical protein
VYCDDPRAVSRGVGGGVGGRGRRAQRDSSGAGEREENCLKSKTLFPS